METGARLRYGAWADGRVRSCDIAINGDVVDARAAAVVDLDEGATLRGAAFDAGRGELLLAAHDALLAAAPRVLGAGEPVADVGKRDRKKLFFDGVAWAGPAHGAALDAEGGDAASVAAAGGAAAALDAGRGALWLRPAVDKVFSRVVSSGLRGATGPAYKAASKSPSRRETKRRFC